MSQTTIYDVASADAYVSSAAPDTNYGYATSLRIGRYSDGRITETFLQYNDLFNDIPLHAQIIKATLELFQYNDADDFQTPSISVAAELADGLWWEGELTFAIRPGTLAGSPSTLHTVHNQNTWIPWDVTAHIQAVINETLPWMGFRMRYTGTSSSTIKFFRSAQYGTDPFSTTRLTIEWDYPFPKLQVGGAWKQIDGAWVNVGGVWKPVTGMLINVGGVWKPLG